MAVEFDLAGADALTAKLRLVSKEIRLKAGRKALRKAANLVVRAAREKAKRFDDPATPSNIPKNIGIQWDNRRYKRTGDLGFRIGVKGGAVLAKKGAGGTPHWRLLEFGTENMAAQPFMRPALEENIQAVASLFSEQLAIELDKALAT